MPSGADDLSCAIASRSLPSISRRATCRRSASSRATSTRALQQRGKLVATRRQSGLVVGNILRLSRCDGDGTDTLDVEGDGLGRVHGLAVGERPPVHFDFAGASRLVAERHPRGSGRQPRLERGDLCRFAPGRVDELALGCVAGECGVHARAFGLGEARHLETLRQLQHTPAAFHGGERTLERVACLTAFDNAHLHGAVVRFRLGEQGCAVIDRSLQLGAFAGAPVEAVERLLQRAEMPLARSDSLVGRLGLLARLAGLVECAPRLVGRLLPRLHGFRIGKLGQTVPQRLQLVEPLPARARAASAPLLSASRVRRVRRALSSARRSDAADYGW